MKLYASLAQLRERARAAGLGPEMEGSIDLYSLGAEAKAKQAEYAIQQLETALNEAVPSMQRLEFFSDAFWICAYATLDVSAQIVNHAYRMGESERAVAFKHIANRVAAHARTSADLKAAYAALRDSAEFSKLDDYRNCSAHRRPVAIEFSYTHRVQVTNSCYVTNTTDGIVEVGSISAILCDNPLEVRPRYGRKKQLPQFLKTFQAALFGKLNKVIKYIEFTA